MNDSENKQLQSKTHPDTPSERRIYRDEVLQELWEAKAKLNAEANYDVAILTARANETAKRLGFLRVP
jgi:hypothetical protein